MTSFERYYLIKSAQFVTANRRHQRKITSTNSNHSCMWGSHSL